MEKESVIKYSSGKFGIFFKKIKTGLLKQVKFDSVVRFYLFSSRKGIV